MKRWIRASEEVKGISDDIYEAWVNALETTGIDEDDVHLLTYEDAKRLEKELAANLRKNGIDLSFKYTVIRGTGGSEIEGLRVAGNTGAIANNLIREVMKRAWEPAMPNAIEYAKKNNTDFYVKDKFGYCKPASAAEVERIVALGDDTQHHGYGSQAYIDVTETDLKQDYFGNILVSRSTLRYD